MPMPSQFCSCETTEVCGPSFRLPSNTVHSRVRQVHLPDTPHREEAKIIVCPHQTRCAGLLLQLEDAVRCAEIMG